MALKRTEMITYNVRDRGRKATGQHRDIDVKGLERLINGPQVQESVKLGDMQGYLGHWPRVKFGMHTQEGGVLDGKVVSLPLAVRAVHLSADEDGNITHQHEFLDTPEGRLAWSLYDSKTGGFSSAMDVMPRTSPSIPSAFYGFDFVFAPNYTGNRGHRAVLDAVGGVALDEEEREDMVALLDAVAGESGVMMAMFDALQRRHQQAIESLEHLARENDLLVGRLAAARAPSDLLDSLVGENGRVAPKLVERAPDFNKYRSMPLAALDKPAGEGKLGTSGDAQIIRQFGIKD